MLKFGISLAMENFRCASKRAVPLKALKLTVEVAMR